MAAPDSSNLADLAARLGARADEDGFTVATAESLTGGLLASSLAGRAAAASWFRGGIVAYAEEVKVELLDVEPGPVVTEATARQMAEGAAELFDADVTLATTGVGGPGPDREEGLEPGTVWLAVRGSAVTLTRLELFEGGPEAVCEAACRAAIELALELTDRM